MQLLDMSVKHVLAHTQLDIVSMSRSTFFFISRPAQAAQDELQQGDIVFSSSDPNLSQGTPAICIATLAELNKFMMESTVISPLSWELLGVVDRVHDEGSLMGAFISLCHMGWSSDQIRVPNVWRHLNKQIVPSTPLLLCLVRMSDRLAIVPTIKSKINQQDESRVTVEHLSDTLEVLKVWVLGTSASTTLFGSSQVLANPEDYKNPQAVYSEHGNSTEHAVCTHSDYLNLPNSFYRKYVGVRSVWMD